MWATPLGKHSTSISKFPNLLPTSEVQCNYEVLEFRYRHATIAQCSCYLHITLDVLIVVIKLHCSAKNKKLFCPWKIITAFYVFNGGESKSSSRKILPHTIFRSCHCIHKKNKVFSTREGCSSILSLLLRDQLTRHGSPLCLLCHNSLGQFPLNGINCPAK